LSGDKLQRQEERLSSYTEKVLSREWKEPHDDDKGETKTASIQARTGGDEWGGEFTFSTTKQKESMRGLGDKKDMY